MKENCCRYRTTQRFPATTVEVQRIMRNPKKVHKIVVNVMSFTLKCIGVWSEVGESSMLKRIIYLIYGITVKLIIWLCVGTMAADFFLNSSNIQIATDDGCILSGLGVIIFKMIIFEIRHEKIIELIDRVYKPVDNIVNASESDVLLIVKWYAFYEQAMELSFITAGGFLAVGLVFVVPIENGSLPLRAEFPFDSTHEPLHAIAIAIQAYTVSTVLIAILAMDGIVLSLCRYTTCQIRILNANFRHCSNKPANNYNKVLHGEVVVDQPEMNPTHFVYFYPNEMNTPGDCFAMRLKMCIRNHQRIIRIVHDINCIFGSTMFVQLFASSSIICLTGFQTLLCSKTFANLAKFSIYLGVSFSHLATWCWGGQMLLHESDKLASSQWASGWENEHSLEMTHLLTMSLTRGNQNLELSAANFYTLSMETFIMILKTSYSVFALLTAVMDDETI